MATVASDGLIHHRNTARKMTGFGLTAPVWPRPDINGASDFYNTIPLPYQN